MVPAMQKAYYNCILLQLHLVRSRNVRKFAFEYFIYKKTSTISSIDHDAPRISLFTLCSLESIDLSKIKRICLEPKTLVTIQIQGVPKKCNSCVGRFTMSGNR